MIFLCKPVIALTALRGWINVEGRVFQPGRDRDVFLDERWYLAPEHPCVTRQDIGIPHLYLVLLAYH